MEGGLLSSPDLAPLYDRAAWMYLFQDFSGSDANRRAERVAIRFGITAWPQHFLIDPTDLRVIGSTGRKLATFQEAFEGAGKIQGTPDPSPEKLAVYDALAEQIQTASSPALAKEWLDHEDIVVRYCAVASLAKHEPAAVAAACKELLAVPHDQLRVLVCKVLKETPHADAAPALEALLKNPSGSKNPNNLRVQVAAALATCGSPASFAVLARFGVGGSPNNTLTRTALDAIAAIAMGDPLGKGSTAREQAREILTRSFPVPLPAATEAEASGKAAEQRGRNVARISDLAEEIHDHLIELTGIASSFPSPYDAAAREELMARWQR